MDIQLDKALEIQGFMEPWELGWLAKQAQTHKTIVEIGSFLGRSTRALADNTSGVVYAVDDWHGPRDKHIEMRGSIFEEFLFNMQGLEGRLHVVKADHGSIDLRDIPTIPDMVFIDGDHSYESVSRDIDFWLKYSTPDALICGHDYALAFDEVMQAVNERFPNVEVAYRTSIWHIRKSCRPLQQYSA